MKPIPAGWVRRLENPQFRKRIREYSRGRRAFWVLGLYTGILAAICFLIVAQEVGHGREASDAGRSIFVAVGIAQGILIGFLSLGLAQWSMVAESTSQCFPLLVITGMSPLRIVSGEILAGLAFASGLVVAGMPMMGLSFLLGGASPAEILGVDFLCLGMALAFSCLGTMSSVMSRGGNLIGMLIKGFLATGVIVNWAVGYFIWVAAIQDRVPGGGTWLQDPSAPFMFFGLVIPGVPFTALLGLFLMATAVSVACRKFYDPSRRAFSPLGFSAVAGMLLLVAAGGATTPGLRVSDDVYYPFNIVAAGVVLVGLLFSAGKDPEETLCPRRRRPLVPFVSSIRLHLLALILVVHVINSIWARAGSFDSAALRRITIYLLGLFGAGLGIVILLESLLPIRRKLVYAALGVFVVWSTVVPFAGVVLAEGGRSFSPSVSLVSAQLLASSSVVGIIPAIDPSDMPQAARGLSSIRSWLWVSVAAIHGLIFVLGIAVGATVKETRAARAARGQPRSSSDDVPPGAAPGAEAVGP